MNNPSRIEIHHDSHVYMSLSDSELIYANALDSLYYRRRVLAFEVAFVYIFDSIPTDTQEAATSFIVPILNKSST